MLYSGNNVDDPRQNSFRICALCKHFQVLEHQREFPYIVDSDYITYECAIVKDKKREDYLMDSDPMKSYQPHPEQGFDCPFWEPFQP